ncbi:MAG: LLM class F420-dependent oxidoreductase [Actinobacteria bacterium]|nr:LLM class F420-dependent oxidoreductase [Actinomycetota bacterium]
MRFGGFIPQGWRMDLQGIDPAGQWDAMVGVARRLEKAGYESGWVYDHFHTVPEPTQESTFEAWTLMAALAPATTTLRLGQMCTCNSYRPPAYMAKVASSVDVISGGRLEFSIGAGWYEHEYLAYGYEFPKASVRIGQLDEAVQIILKMWADDEATFEGKYYSVKGAINRPKPLQDPHPPMWIAGGGEKLTMRTVAKYADYSNFGGSPEAFAAKSEILAGHCEQVGRDFSEITRSIHLFCMVDLGAAELERAAAQMGSTVDKFRGSAMTVIGSAEEVADRIGAYVEAGCGYFIMNFPDAIWGDSIEAFASGVAPAVA